MISSEKQIKRYRDVAKTVQAALEEDSSVSTAVLGYYASIAWGHKYDLAKDKNKCFAFFQYIRKKGIVSTKKCSDGSIMIAVNPKWLKDETEIVREERLEEEIARVDTMPLDSPADFVEMVKIYTNDKNVLSIVEKKATELFVRKEELEKQEEKIKQLKALLGISIGEASFNKDNQSLEFKDITIEQLAKVLSILEKEGE